MKSVEYIYFWTISGWFMFQSQGAISLRTDTNLIFRWLGLQIHLTATLYLQNNLKALPNTTKNKDMNKQRFRKIEDKADHTKYFCNDLIIGINTYWWMISQQVASFCCPFSFSPYSAVSSSLKQDIVVYVDIKLYCNI